MRWHKHIRRPSYLLLQDALFRGSGDLMPSLIGTPHDNVSAFTSNGMAQLYKDPAEHKKISEHLGAILSNRDRLAELVLRWQQTKSDIDDSREIEKSLASLHIALAHTRLLAPWQLIWSRAAELQFDRALASCGGSTERLQDLVEQRLGRYVMSTIGEFRISQSAHLLREGSNPTQISTTWKQRLWSPGFANPVNIFNLSNKANRERELNQSILFLSHDTIFDHFDDPIILLGLMIRAREERRSYLNTALYLIDQSFSEMKSDPSLPKPISNILDYTLDELFSIGTFTELPSRIQPYLYIKTGPTPCVMCGTQAEDILQYAILDASEDVPAGQKTFNTRMTASRGRTVGNAVVIQDTLFAPLDIEPGSVLVVHDAGTHAWTAAAFSRASGVITERGGFTSHGATIAREMNIPCIVGATGIVSKIQSGERVRMDADACRVEVWKDAKWTRV